MGMYLSSHIYMKQEYAGDTCRCRGRHQAQAGGGAVYGLGLLGAAIYYFQHAAGFTDYLLGVLKALVWPAYIVYKVLERIHM